MSHVLREKGNFFRWQNNSGHVIVMLHLALVI